MAEREASPRLSLASLDFLARAFLARVTILRDRSQSIFFLLSPLQKQPSPATQAISGLSDHQCK